MNSFMSDNRYFIGANYWASHNSIQMWENWDGAVVEEDFRKLSEYGIRALRMFLVWPVFQPLKAIIAGQSAYEYRMMPGEIPLPDTEAGQAGVSEEACDHFAEFCRLADKYNLKLIVGLITGHMSFRNFFPPAFEGRNWLNDPTLIKWEVRFVRYFVKRFKDEPAIAAWDLGNECSNVGGATQDSSYVWTTAITAAIRESDPTRPVVSGLASYGIDLNTAFNVREHAEIVDVLTTHPYQIFSATRIDPIDTMRAEIDPTVRAALYETIGKKPTFVEEVGSIGYTNNSEKTEAAFLNTMLWSTWANGNRGCFWWCAFDQGQFDYAPYDWNNYGSDYGFFRADGSPKPIAEVTRKFAKFLETYEYAELPHHGYDAVCIVPREMSDPLKVMDSAYIFAKQAGFELRFAHADEKLPDAKLYIMPSVSSGKPIFLHRLNELLEKVRNGASLYFSLGDTLFRRLPELTGLTVASRERGGTEQVTMDGIKYNLGGSYRLNIESVADTCTVLATGEDGRPVYVRNQYGKGAIYFAAFPLEAQLGDRAGIFKSKDNTPYYHFYEKFAEEAAADHAVRSNNLCVLTSEHDIAENRRLIVAVNYANIPAKADFTFKNGWKFVKYHVGSDDIPANDAVIIEVEK